MATDVFAIGILVTDVLAADISVNYLLVTFLLASNILACDILGTDFEVWCTVLMDRRIQGGLVQDTCLHDVNNFW